MTRLLKGILCLTLLGVWVMPAGAFALLGPFKTGANGGEAWQAEPFHGRPQGLGYTLGGDIGGPMFPFEAYRWNVPTITYAFDATFLRYFGTNGMAEVEKAFEILNALPAASAMSETLDEFPLDTKSENADAAALGLLDLKSHTLAFLIEELGLANPERFVFGLRGRQVFPNFTNYSVIQLNYDPVTAQPSRYVNGVLYNYVTFDALGPQGAEWASAVEWYNLDPLRIPYSSVVGGWGNPDLVLGESPDLSSAFFSAQGLFAGQYFNGLTRDDVGGIRFLLSTNNFVYETLLPTVVPASVTTGGSPWNSVFVTNVVASTNVAVTNVLGTNIISNFITTALRPGVNKLTFQRVDFDSIVGSTFTPITNRYTDSSINVTNGRIVKQKVARAILRPDITFVVDDLGTVQGLPILAGRSSTIGWSNNAAINSSLLTSLGGPGTITPGIIIAFTDLLPYYFSEPGGGDSDVLVPVSWGSFDGSDQPPVVYPIFSDLTLDDLRNLATRKNN